MNERIEKIVNDELKSGNLAGVSICAIKNGKEIYNKQYIQEVDSSYIQFVREKLNQLIESL